MKNIIVLMITFSLTFSFLTTTNGQTAPFDIHLEEMSIQGLPGLQAFAYGQYNGKWLIIGGRIDGLHQRQPFASFDIDGHNTNLIVVDPVAGTFYNASIESLPAPVREQMSSTNMQFHQEGRYLYLIGGYSYSASKGDHVTYDNLCAVDLPAVIDAVINDQPFTDFFRQITDPAFAVTGGQLGKIYDVYYLVGGNKFDGRYNPMNNNTFTQVYTDQARRFLLEDDGNNLKISHLESIDDQDNLHKRDYNLVPQIMPDGSEGLTAFSGVFQKDVDLPFLNCVNFDSLSYSVNASFSQYYNHYHCPKLALYSESVNEMHNVFFGGIAQYYDSLGLIARDDNVPFVNTIARVTRNGAGEMSEHRLPATMPGLMGAAAEFIPAADLPEFSNSVIKIDSLEGDTTLVGYIFGGINSSAPNIFFINNGTQSSASSKIIKVYLIKNPSVGIHELNKQSKDGLGMQIFPNPGNGEFGISFTLVKESAVKITVHDMNGRTIIDDTHKNGISVGKNTIVYNRAVLGKGVYIITLETPDMRTVQKLIVSD